MTPPTIMTTITHGLYASDGVTMEEAEQFVAHESMFMGELRRYPPTMPGILAAWHGTEMVQGWRGARVQRSVSVLYMSGDTPTMAEAMD